MKKEHGIARIFTAHYTEIVLKKIFTSSWKWDLFFIVLLTFSLPLFFYKLGQSSLVSWDEAWYASIAQNMLHTGDLFHSIYNGKLFADKPPGGMWPTAIFFHFLGISAFTARLTSALCGVFSLFALYLLGKELFNRMVGFCAAVSLLASFWFLYRSRSGDLDAPLTLFYILSIYLALKATKNKKYLYYFAIVFGYLALIKGVVFMALLLPAILLIFWGNKLYKLREFIVSIVIASSIFGVWILFQILDNPEESLYHFTHSVRNSSLHNDVSKSLQLLKDYLHNGIGKWFWPALLSIFGGLIFIQKRFILLAVIFISYSVPFLFSPELQLWHFIPLYPFMVLAIYGFIYVSGIKLFHGFQLSPKKSEIIITICMILFAGYYSSLQLRTSWYQFINIDAYVSDEEILATAARTQQGKLYFDGDFEPAGAFYSDRVVTRAYDLRKLFDSDNNFLLITNDWRLEQEHIKPDEYIFIKKDRDKVLVRKP